MRDGRRRAGDVEPPNPLVDRAVTNGRALVLAQVLEPGLGDEAFDVTPVSSTAELTEPQSPNPQPAPDWSNSRIAPSHRRSGLVFDGVAMHFSLDE